MINTKMATTQAADTTAAINATGTATAGTRLGSMVVDEVGLRVADSGDVVMEGRTAEGSAK